MNKSISIHYQIFNESSQLDEAARNVLNIARNALINAYAPYSGFKVAAAILLDNGKILVGTNQENASYGLCICAEQNVLSHAGSQYHDTSIRLMAVTAMAPGRSIEHPISPCGACRQVISEHEDRHHQPIRIILQGETGSILSFDSVKDLLPFSFSGKDLGKTSL